MSITLIIIALNLIVSYMAFQDHQFFDRWADRPYAVVHGHQYERWLTSGFVHGNWLHFGINMFVLWQFGSVVEETFMSLDGPIGGRIKYVTIYFIILIASSIPTFLKHKDNPSYSSVGASGAVSGVLFAYVLFYPLNLLYLYGIIPIYGIVAALAYLAYSSWASRRENDHINHDAHLYGALSGLLLTMLFFPESIQIFLLALGIM
ncbi:MAG: rhomboid family intramembrane serine protease [Saprospiraceae bacterium]|jgi:membrane associated rhomboid family serine protease|nr:rhomboid family intramembrane serine protease [Saprospiraceae bacterium]